MRDLRPRKRPRQARAQITFDALLEACARLLRRNDWASLTTNAIAERAGVSIGSLYEFFPNREAILAELTRRRLEALASAVEAELEAALALDDPVVAIDRLLRRILAEVSADRALYRALFREARFLRALPETERSLAALLALVRAGSERARDRIALPAPEADAWLIVRMTAQAVLEIAFLDERAPDRELLIRELVRLTFRMVHARDPEGRRRSSSRRKAAAPGPR